MQTQIFHNPEIKQINFADSRYYTVDGVKFFPSVTEVLSVFPKGFGFEQWLKDTGSNAKEIADRAAKIGSKIHQITEYLNEGQEIKWADEAGNAQYSIDEWKMLLRFADFWKKCTPTLVANEQSFCSPTLRIGGTLDRVVMIGGKRWLIDIKTSNYLHKTHELQLAAYSELWNESNPNVPIEYTGVLWLKSTVRTNKIDIDKMEYQGVTEAGAWQLKTFDRHYTDAFKIFLHTQAIWEEENPTYKPMNLILPDTIKL